MAGRDDAYRAAFRRAGIIPAATLEAMFDGARTLAKAPLPGGRAVAVLTNAGGPGVAAVDALEHHGLSLARISGSTRRALKEALPEGASLANPIDMLASASPQDFGRCLAILIGAPEVDSVLVVFPPPPMYETDAVAESLVEVAENSPKPVLVAVMGGRSIGPAVERLRAAHIPEFHFPEPAASALAMLVARAEATAVESTVPTRPAGIRAEAAAAVLMNSPEGWLTPTATTEVLEAYGIPAPPQAVVNGPDEAVHAAGRIGGKVALKLVAAHLPHKSDVGGVRLGLASEDEIRSNYSDLAKVAADVMGPATVSVQPMVDGAHDLIVGGVRDPQFGPLLMFGSGGVEIEGLGDVEFVLAPPTENDVDFLLAQTWAGRRLAGYRSIPAGDTDAVKDVMQRIGWLLADHSRVTEVEVNPLRTRSPVFGTVALDVRIRIE
jgi:acetyltransferase